MERIKKIIKNLFFAVMLLAITGSISVRSGVWDTNLMQNRTGDADGEEEYFHVYR